MLSLIYGAPLRSQGIHPLAGLGQAYAIWAISASWARGQSALFLKGALRLNWNNTGYLWTGARRTVLGSRKREAGCDRNGEKIVKQLVEAAPTRP